jgi:hypothetical protein
MQILSKATLLALDYRSAVPPWRMRILAARRYIIPKMLTAYISFDSYPTYRRYIGTP